MGFVPLLVAIALGNIATNAAAVVLMVPLAIDCGFALSDNTNGKQYMICSHYDISTRSGYSLDIKVKRLLAKLQSCDKIEIV